MEAQDKARDGYTAAVVTRNGLRSAWKWIQFVGVIFLFRFGWKSDNLDLCLSLARHLHSFDDTCDKAAQSFPKAICIFNAMQENGGFRRNLSAACTRVWQIKPLPLTQIWGSGSHESSSVRRWAPRPGTSGRN